MQLSTQHMLDDGEVNVKELLNWYATIITMLKQCSCIGWHTRHRDFRNDYLPS